MKTIYKYELGVKDEQSITLPSGAEILTVQVQKEKPCLWVLVDLDEEITQLIKIVIIGTGHVITDSRFKKYLGTFQLSEGSFVGHVFEVV